MKTPMKLSYLPSGNFQDLKKAINYDLLDSYKKPISIQKVDEWIEEFFTTMNAHLTNENRSKLIKKYKDCIDFNYIINEITQKIYSLFDLWEAYTLTEKIKKWHKQFFTTNHDLPCKQKDKYMKYELKQLYDLCEYKNLITENQGDIIKRPDCEEIISNMNKSRDTLINERVKLERQYRLYSIRGISCDPSILDTEFPSITCSPVDESALRTEEVSADPYPANTEESDEEAETVLAYSSGGLMVQENEQLTMKEEGESRSGTPSNTLNTVGLPIFGVLGCSFLFYKFTPVGSIFRSRIQNKGIIPINKDDYSTNEVLPNIPNNNDIYSENTQYKISYQTL